MAQFTLPSGRTSRPVVHRTVEEIWYIVSGEGEMWRKHDHAEQVTALHPGVGLTIPVGTAFQFSAAENAPLAAIGVTMPPWPAPTKP